MWDGNIILYLKAQSKQKVEREPMWDGNLPCTTHQCHTRGLSENQCGMETFFLAASYSSRVMLSENQCGMETLMKH